MRRGLLLFALVCVVLGGLAYRYVVPSMGRGTASLLSTTATESASSFDPAQQARTQSGMTGAADLAALPALHRERIEVGDALWEAATPEQAAWLNRHGFPTSGQLAAFNGAQAAQLPADGRARSPVDVVVAESVAMSDPVVCVRRRHLESRVDPTSLLDVGLKKIPLKARCAVSRCCFSPAVAAAACRCRGPAWWAAWPACRSARRADRCRWPWRWPAGS